VSFIGPTKLVAAAVELTRRPTHAMCIFPHMTKVEAEEDTLGLTLLATIDGLCRTVSMEVVAPALTDSYSLVPEEEFSVHRHRREELVIFFPAPESRSWCMPMRFFIFSTSAYGSGHGCGDRGHMHAAFACIQ
jgi:hypothetical protein